MIMGLAAGVAIYYLQVYHFYEPVAADQVDAVEMTSLITGLPEEILADAVEAIDADSSPIRFRACFTTPMSQSFLTESYVLYDGAIPLTAPGWFECFDATEIGDALAAGTGLAFMGQENIEYGVDRIVAVLEDGRGFVWHQLNRCGEKTYDGGLKGKECPPRAELAQPEQESN